MPTPASPSTPPATPEPEGPSSLSLPPAAEILLTRTDRIREDVRALHPLLDLLDPPEGDPTLDLARSLLSLLMGMEATLAAQAQAFRSLEARLSAIETMLLSLDDRLALLLGEPA